MERWTFWPLLFPLTATGFYYTFLFPSPQLLHVFIPLIISFIALCVWIRLNPKRLEELYLRKKGLKGAVSKGAAVGIVLGLLNLFIIVKLSSWLGYSNEFLRKTPHAVLPVWVMFPLGIVFISALVEILFRGWILGRFLSLFDDTRRGVCCAVLVSALYFSFDPFMVIYFKGYHWLALTDGVVWGGLLHKTNNLFSSISAHTVEVWIVYLALKVFYA